MLIYYHIPLDVSRKYTKIIMNITIYEDSVKTEIRVSTKASADSKEIIANVGVDEENYLFVLLLFSPIQIPCYTLYLSGFFTYSIITSFK